MNTDTISRKQRVYDFLAQAKRSGNDWVDGSMISSENVGGKEGLRRLRELRAEGYQIQMRRNGRSAQYRLTRLKPVKG